MASGSASSTYRVPSDEENGVFDRLEGPPGQHDSLKNRLIEKIEAGLATHYGVALEPWITFLVTKGALLQSAEAD